MGSNLRALVTGGDLLPVIVDFFVVSLIGAGQQTGVRIEVAHVGLFLNWGSIR